MKNYELTYLISADLTDEESKGVCEKIAGFVAELSGLINNSLEPVKIRLGYPIKKKNTAYLTSLGFSLDPQKIEELEKKILSEIQVLRHAIVVKIKKKEKKSRRLINTVIMRQETNKEKKVELENMDKKIEEILQ